MTRTKGAQDVASRQRSVRRPKHRLATSERQPGVGVFPIWSNGLSFQWFHALVFLAPRLKRLEEAEKGQRRASWNSGKV